MQIFDVLDYCVYIHCKVQEVYSKFYKCEANQEMQLLTKMFNIKLRPGSLEHSIENTVSIYVQKYQKSQQRLMWPSKVGYTIMNMRYLHERCTLIETYVTSNIYKPYQLACHNNQLYSMLQQSALLCLNYSLNANMKMHH